MLESFQRQASTPKCLTQVVFKAKLGIRGLVRGKAQTGRSHRVGHVQESALFPPVARNGEVFYDVVVSAKKP